MSAPLEPPTGYVFYVGDYAGPVFTDPAYWGITDPESQDAMRVATIHEVCGCLVMWGMIDAHDTWHASLTAP